MKEKQIKRVAIYTRKSTDEGLDMEIVKYIWFFHKVKRHFGLFHDFSSVFELNTVCHQFDPYLHAHNSWSNW